MFGYEEDAEEVKKFKTRLRLFRLVFFICRPAFLPREAAFDVAKYACQEMNGDKLGRQKLYQDLGWELDDTVIPVEEK